MTDLSSTPEPYLDDQKPVKMAIIAHRVICWSNEKFLEEYTGVHAEMTKQIASVVPILRNYTQVVACGQPRVKNLQARSNGKWDWDCLTILQWSSLRDLWESFQLPEYKASAGKHVFVEENDSFGILSEPMVDHMFDPAAFEERRGAVVVGLLLAKSAGKSEDDGQLANDIQMRADMMKRVGARTRLLRYVINRAVTPADTESFFAGTPFVTADWSSMVALEQYWFPDIQAVEKFFGDAGRKETYADLPASFDLGRCLDIVGKENVVVQKDSDF